MHSCPAGSRDILGEGWLALAQEGVLATAMELAVGGDYSQWRGHIQF